MSPGLDLEINTLHGSMVCTAEGMWKCRMFPAALEGAQERSRWRELGAPWASWCLGEESGQVVKKFNKD